MFEGGGGGDEGVLGSGSMMGKSLMSILLTVGWTDVWMLTFIFMRVMGEMGGGGGVFVHPCPPICIHLDNPAHHHQSFPCHCPIP